MKQRVQHPPSPHALWPWPLDLNSYDHHPLLREAERVQLDQLVHHHASLCPATKGSLQRLLQPLHDALTYLQIAEGKRRAIVRVLCLEIQRRGTAFWGWTLQEWYESIGQSTSAFAHRFGLELNSGRKVRPHLPALLYLLCPHLSIEPILPLVQLRPLADKLFGKQTIDTATQQILAPLRSWGYHQSQSFATATCVCYLLLRNRSPRLEDLTIELLEETFGTCSISSVQDALLQVSRALVALGIIPRALPRRDAAKPLVSGTDGSVSEEWLGWCQRWRTHSSLADQHSTYYALLKVGRWLKVHHPEVTSPAQWTYELAAEFVSAVMQMRVGEWADASTRARIIPAARIGQPLRPHAKHRMLRAMSAFLRDCQEWGWIPMHLNLARALRPPRSLRNLLAPNPRVIDKDLWAKLLWAAMNLAAKDLPLPGNGNESPAYPLELVRAIALIWCFAALRSDEIWRLRVGCIRWQHEDVMIPETGELLPRDAVCFLDVPVNKTSGAYTKAVHPVVGKRINEWEHVRPQEQLHDLDRKTSEQVQFLFSYRGLRVSKRYINQALIPLLCRKAGIPEQDSRGPITSHRARATIASMLYNAKEPLTIFELKEYLGHRQLSSTQHYLQVDPTKLASRVAKAGYLEQNMATIEVLLDQSAVLSGAAARGEVWKYYDLGHGYCTNTFWAECKHRMACARCPFYRPKHASLDQLVEGKANLMRMLEYVTLTEDEQVLVREGIELHQALLEKLSDVPTPAGPTPRELEGQRQGQVQVISPQTVQRNTKKHQNKEGSDESRGSKPQGKRDSKGAAGG